MKKLHTQKYKEILTRILIFFMIIIATISLIYYAKGYRINLEEQIIMKTGVLNIETQPNRANYYINEEINGRTPKTISSIPEGAYNLKIELDGYHNLEYSVGIIAEKSTPVSAFMFKEEPIYDILNPLEKEIVLTRKSNSHNLLFLLLKEEIEDKINYEILSYKTNVRFWQVNNNMEKVFEIAKDPEIEIIDLEVSPNNNFGILKTNTTNYLISFYTNSILKEIEHDIRWSKDELSIFWQEDDKLMKLNIQELENPIEIFTQTNYMDLIYYDTDANGDIYILYKIYENEFLTLSKLNQKNEEILLLEKIYYQENDNFLNSSREEIFINYRPFKNSPQSTLFVGKPIEFLISLETKNIFFKTTNAIYQYDIEKERYILINPYESEIIDFSPNKQKISFWDKGKNRLGIFTFNKEIGNYSVKLGTHYIDTNITQEKCYDIAWHNNSQNIYYICENTLYVNDTKGENKISLIPFFGNHILIENNKKIKTLIEKKHIENRDEILDKLNTKSKKENFEQITAEMDEYGNAILEFTIN